MADFGYFSDTDDSAVEELVSQAKELSALEQVAAINCSSFTDSTLPDDIEARFRRLKSLPASRPDPVSSSSSKIKQQKKHLNHAKSVASKQNPGNKSGLSDEESRNKPDLGLKSGFEKDTSGDFSDSNKIFTPVKQTQKRRTGSSSSSSIELASPPSSEPENKSKSKWFEKLSPSKIVGYIFRSPKKGLTKKKNLKSFNDSGRERNIDDFDEFLSDLNAFSVEDQRKMLKKALKEQQKMRKEAAEIIKMAKQASAKFDFDD
ncbi:hypothetical protein AALP_AA1G320900 [Arabis alpina]|uniref:Uncharacterized protein n=1 Tax=Arabis alpina TaxID=50452 RepID=A0A087HS25_ARAAL|nr:hypothetical protein AALP_AA1G320900 [Arabis alpina]